MPVSRPLDIWKRYDKKLMKLKTGYGQDYVDMSGYPVYLVMHGDIVHSIYRIKSVAELKAIEVNGRVRMHRAR